MSAFTFALCTRTLFKSSGRGGMATPRSLFNAQSTFSRLQQPLAFQAQIRLKSIKTTRRQAPQPSSSTNQQVFTGTGEPPKGYIKLPLVEYSEPFDVMRKPISRGIQISFVLTIGCVLMMSFLSSVVPFAFVERKPEGDLPEELNAKVKDMMEHDRKKRYEVYACKVLFHLVGLAAIIRFVGLNFHRVTRIQMANPKGVERSIRAMTPESKLIVHTVASDWHLAKPRVGQIQEFDLLGPLMIDKDGKRLPHQPPALSKDEIKARQKKQKISLMDWINRTIYLGWTQERLRTRSLWDYENKSWKNWQVAPLMNVHDIFLYRLPNRYKETETQFWNDKATFEAGLLLYGNYQDRLNKL